MKKTNPLLQSQVTAEMVNKFYINIKPRHGCWLWVGYVEDGYAKITVKLGDKSKQIQAHRLSYAMHTGDISAGMFINHTCRNKNCVHPDHLYQGTQAENNRDLGKDAQEMKARRAEVMKRYGVEKLNFNE